MEIVERVRQVSSIAEIASQYTTLRKRGRKWVGLCPFHAEKTPSFTVDEDKQLYHCFGCGVGGDVFSLVMQKEGLTFPEALKSLAEKYHVPLPQKSRLDPQVVKLEEKLGKINELALGFFRARLREGAEGGRARQYLASRGLDEAAIETLRIGYAPTAWTALYDFFRERGTSPDLLEKGGLVVPGRKPGAFYDRFRGRVIFPIFGLTGKVVAFGGRSLGTENPKYLNSPDTPLYSKGRLLYGLNFTKDAIRDAGEAVLVEGYTDFAALYQAGIPNVAASLGTALTADQVGQLARFARRVVVNYDGDAAGLAAMERAVPLFLESGVHARVLVLPDGQDPDAYLRRAGREPYLALMACAAGGLKFLIDRRLRGLRLEIPEEKARAARDLLREVQRVPDSIARSEHLRELGEALRLREDELRTLAASPPPPAAADQVCPFSPGEKRLLQILMEDREVAAALLAEIDEAVFGGLAAEPVFRCILDCCRGGRSWSFPELGAKVAPELLAHVSRALLETIPAGSAEEARECLWSLRRLQLEKQLQEIQRRIVRSEKADDQPALTELLSRRHRITTELHRVRLAEQAGLSPDAAAAPQTPDGDA